MSNDIQIKSLENRILDARNIFSAIFALESYVFDRGLLDSESPVELIDEDGVLKRTVANDLELFAKLQDKYDVELIELVIATCRMKLKEVLADNEKLFEAKVYFKIKKLDRDDLVFRPLHTARLLDLICMVSILNLLMFEDDYQEGTRRLSDLSKLIPSNFYGNIPSTNPQYLFHKWQKKYKEYSKTVIERCRKYQNSHEYKTEVSLDIKNFFPSISPKYLHEFIISKLSTLYRGKEDFETLQIAVTKLLYFRLAKENIETWKNEYYISNLSETDLYMNCGIPQGLPQSYFFGNLCMLKIQEFLMDKDCFQGDAYFYVDDSVIYVQAALDDENFHKKIENLNGKLSEWCEKNKNCNLNNYLAKKYVIFQNQLNYKIQFHQDEKSTCMHVDEIDTLTKLILDVNRQTYDMGNLSRNMDELDDSVALEKLQTLDEVINGEIKELKNKKDSPTKQKANITASRLVLLRRFKKFFLYRIRMLSLKEGNHSISKCYEQFEALYFKPNKECADTFEPTIKPAEWFEMEEDGIFKTEYQLIIQNLNKKDAASFCDKIAAWEVKFLADCNVAKIDERKKFLFYTKDSKTSLLIKSLKWESYASLQLWLKENFSGVKRASSSQMFPVLRGFLWGDDANWGWKHLFRYGFQDKGFTLFVLHVSQEYQRRILNAFFSEMMGVQISDATTFVKSNSRKCCYSELRVLAYLRNRKFKTDQFIDFVDSIQEKDLSNTMSIDMELMEVLGLFISRVRNPEWVDGLICTHRIVKGLWYNGSKFLHAYTLHNEEHAVTLIHKSVELINRIDFFALKQVDYYILFLSCYLHDISMVVHPDLGYLSVDTPKNKAFISSLMVEMKNGMNGFMNVTSEPAKGARMKDAGKFLVDVFSKVYEFFETKTRSSHAKDSANFVRDKADDLLGYLEPAMVSYVAKVSESHGFDVLDVYGLKSEAKNDAISLKYMMILIRLADLMDVAHDRVNYHLLRQNLKQLSSESKFHWISHLVTDKLELKTSYKINDQFKQERQKSEAEKGSDRIVKPIFETINFDLYLNFKQLTTDDKSLKCQHCNCELLEDDTMMLTIFSSNSNRMCNRTTCPISCKWMMKKHQWLLEELVALNDYLFSVNEFLFDTSIRFNIHCVDDVRLDPDMFDDIQSYLLKEEI